MRSKDNVKIDSSSHSREEDRRVDRWRGRIPKQLFRTVFQAMASRIGLLSNFSRTCDSGGSHRYEVRHIGTFKSLRLQTRGAELATSAFRCCLCPGPPAQETLLLPYCQRRICQGVLEPSASAAGSAICFTKTSGFSYSLLKEGE